VFNNRIHGEKLHYPWCCTENYTNLWVETKYATIDLFSSAHSHCKWHKVGLPKYTLYILNNIMLFTISHRIVVLSFTFLFLSDFQIVFCFKRKLYFCFNPHGIIEWKNPPKPASLKKWVGCTIALYYAVLWNTWLWLVNCSILLSDVFVSLNAIFDIFPGNQSPTLLIL